MPNSERRLHGSNRKLWGTPLYNPDTQTWSFINVVSDGTDSSTGGDTYYMTDGGTGDHTGYYNKWTPYRRVVYEPQYPEPEVKDGKMHLKPAKFMITSNRYRKTAKEWLED